MGWRVSMIGIVDKLGETRFLANLIPLRGPNPAWKIYGDHPATPMIPRSQWKPVSWSHFTPPIKDQNGIGACNAFATINTMEHARAAAGLPYVELSAGYLYGNINGQRDQGSMLEDALEFVTLHGTCTAATVGPLVWQKSRWSPAAEAESANYKIVEAYWCPSFDHCASAIQKGFTLDVGLMWADGDDTDGNGWIPERPRGSQGGHAIMRDELVFDGARWGLGGPNSWSARWGANGRMVIPEKRFDSAIGGYWACRVVTDSGGEDAPDPTN